MITLLMPIVRNPNDQKRKYFLYFRQTDSFCAVMTPTHSFLRSPAALLGLAAVLVSAPLAQAASVASWTQFSGSISSGLNSSSPVLGNGTSESADGQTIYAATPTYTLANVGDAVTFSGSVTFSSLNAPQADQFRFGIYDVNGQSGATGWLGYFASNSGTSGGPTYSRLWERSNPNTGSFGSGTGAVTIANVNATPNNTSFVSGTYNFSIAALRTASGLTLTWTLVNSTASTYSVSGTFADTTAQSYVFNRVGIFTGGGLNANQASFSNMDMTFTPAAVPEPSSFAAIAGLAGIGFVAMRRRR